MIDPLNTIWMLFKVLLVFYIIYVAIPSRVIRFDYEDRSFLDRFFISLTHSHFAIIIIVHFLSFLSLLETFSMIFFYAAAYVWGIWWTRGKSPSALADCLGMRAVVRILDMSEGEYGLMGALYDKLVNWKQLFIKMVKQTGRDMFLNPFGGILLLVAFAGAAYIRFHHSFTHLYLGASDSYLHMAWAKYLGQNEIYKDGIYPYGYEAVVTALNKLFLIDPYYLTRFLGPLAGFLIVLSIYYFMKKYYSSSQVVWIAVFLYGIVTSLPSILWRQISALPMEYAAMFLLPGIHFLLMYYKHKKIKYLVLAGECVALTLLIHPYVTVFLGISYLIVFFINLPVSIKRSFFIETAAVMTGSIFVGIIPLGIGMFIGREFHGSLGYIKSSTKLPGDVSMPSATVLSETDPLLILMLILIAIIFIVWFILVLRKKFVEAYQNSQASLVLVLCCITLYALYRAQYFGLPLLMDPVRIGIFLAIIMVAVYALSLDLIRIMIPYNNVRRLLQSAVCVFVTCIVFSTSAVGVPRGSQYEYDEAVESYLRIKRNYPALNWTIISPVEQYQQCLGYGWHYEIWQFIKGIEDKEKIEIPTDYVFLFVEKIPLNSKKPVSVYELEEYLPSTGVNPSAFYYFNMENRYNIQSKAYYWAENYLIQNKDMSIYYDSDVLRVYLLKQDGSHPKNLGRYSYQ